MEPSKRRLLSGIAALTAGAALIPVTQVQAQSVPLPATGGRPSAGGMAASVTAC